MSRMPAFGRVLARMFTLQAAWNYERLQGIGFAHAAEPALRALPGGRDGERYPAALSRQARFFNAHPYLAGLAVGAAVRAELDGEPAERIARFREALCGPLGSIGDRLFWASWLPTCSMIGLIAYALGARMWAAVLFLVLYNAAHLTCRVWGLRAGWERGSQVVAALQGPFLRTVGGLAAPCAGLAVAVAVPIVFVRQLAGANVTTVQAAAAGVALVLALMRLGGARLTGVRLATLVLGLTFIAGIVWP
ncbi:MAG: PTS system mannose/fructose/sorbose family transporter subunit IID [Gemmatimonadales bacterium]